MVQNIHNFLYSENTKGTSCQFGTNFSFVHLDTNCTAMMRVCTDQFRCEASKQLYLVAAWESKAKDARTCQIRVDTAL